MTKKSNKGDGTLLSPEFKEITKRLKTKDPLLDSIVEHDTAQIVQVDSTREITEEDCACFEDTHVSSAQQFTREEIAILRAARLLLDRIEIDPREWRGPGVEGTRKPVNVSARLPKDVVRRARRLPGPLAWHVERAMKLYLAVREAK